MTEPEAHSLQVEIVTPDGSVYTGEASMVIVPGVEGELGFLSRHEPLVSLVKVGEARVQLPDGTWERFATGIGYVQVLFDKVLLVVDQASRVYGGTDVTADVLKALQ